jgi:aldehyde:ferredoxin oxidoreductase
MTDLQGTILWVDLGSGKIEREPMREDLRLNYIGGRGINSRLLFEEVGPETEPLSPENRLIFGTSPLSGTTAPSTARFTVTVRSPLTGILGDANAGGHFGPAVIKGKAAEPAYLFIDDEKAEIRSARHLWGKTTKETEEAIKEELKDRKVRVASIGQAGENLVKIASITHEERSASRTGVGAVMGSKNLKAVAVRGTRKVPLSDPEGFNRLTKEMHQAMSQSKAYESFRKFGGAAGTGLTDKVGFLAIRNFQQAGGFEGIDQFNPQSIADKYYQGSTGCYGCPIRCGKKFEIPEGPYKGEKGNKTEEGAFSPYGPVCGNSYIPAIMAVVMEWYEKGIVSGEDLDGITMTWGNYEGMIEMMRKVAFREGFGYLLAEGIVEAARRIGKGAEDYVSHSKGMVMAGIDCRMLKGTALCFATSTRGADHLRGLPTIEFSTLIPGRKIDPGAVKAKYGSEEASIPSSYKKAQAAIYHQHESLVLDMLQLCRFVRFGTEVITLPALSSLYSMATGIDLDEKSMMTAAERVYNMERAFLVRVGISRKDDILVGKWVKESVPTGSHKGEMIDPKKWEAMLDEYYHLRGWNSNGIPTPDKLKELDLKDVSEKIHKKDAKK